MKRVYGILLAACLLLTACGETVPHGQESDQQPTQNAETNDLLEQEGAEQPPAPVVPALPPMPADPWRDAYAGFLEGLAEDLAQFRDFTHPDYDPNAPEGGADQVSGTYTIYDIDKNGTPELLLRYGLTEAGSHTSVYGYENETVVLYGDIPSGHTAFYTWPGENGLAYNWGHMGGHFVDRIYLANGELVQEKFFQEGTDAPVFEYTPMEQVLPGSLYLFEARTYVELPEIRALTLPIYEYGVRRTEETDSARQEAVKRAVEAVLENGAEFYGVTADGFGGDTGWTTLTEYLQPGGITEFADRPLRIDGAARWEDVNVDGVQEAILIVRNEEGDSFDNVCYVILTEEDGTVYAYCLNYMNSTVLEDGVFKTPWGENYAFSFGGGQAYQYTPGQELP